MMKIRSSILVALILKNLAIRSRFYFGRKRKSMKI